MGTKTYQASALMIRAAAARTVDVEARTAEFVLTTGATVVRHSWLEGEYLETIDLDGADLSRAVGAPVCISHRSDDLGAVVGVIEEVWREEVGLVGRVRFSRRPEAEAILMDIKDGILRQGSIGASVEEYELREREGVRELIARKWTLLEYSIVPIGADPGAVVRSHDAPQTVIVRSEGEDTEDEAAAAPADGASGGADTEDQAAPSPDVAGAIEWLGNAIVLHQGHMDGSAPTTDESQHLMMQQMLRAYDLLGGKAGDLPWGATDDESGAAADPNAEPAGDGTDIEDKKKKPDMDSMDMSRSADPADPAEVSAAIVEMAMSAGCPDLAASLIRSKASKAEAEARIAEFGGIKRAVEAARRSYPGVITQAVAAEAMKAGGIELCRKMLFERLMAVDASTEISNSITPRQDELPVQNSEKKPDVNDIWAKYRAAQR